MLKLSLKGDIGAVVYITIQHIVAVYECAGAARILTLAGVEYSVTATVDDIFNMIKESGYL